MPNVSVTDLGDNLHLIDAFMHDEAERLACYVFDTPDRVLIECGPSRTVGHLFDALDTAGIDDVAVVAVTHIHLDHAGAAGHLARRFPNARIAVHAAGARHLADPTRLVASTVRVYGEDGMARLWGPIEPVPPDRIEVLDDGSRLSLGAGRSIEILHTPGHAPHHVAYFEEQSGGMFVGDAVGIAFPHAHLIQPVTPPPDFDPGLVSSSLRRMAQRSPAFIGLAHYGIDRRPVQALEQAERSVWEWVRWARTAASSLDPDDMPEALRAHVLAGYRAAGHPEPVVRRYDEATFWPMQTAGMLRWLGQRPSHPDPHLP